MPVTITVFYPKDEESTFNLDYYVSKHMPMVLDLMRSHGMIGYRISKVVSDDAAFKSPYAVQCLLEFSSAGTYKKALEVVGPELMADVPNFSNQNPVSTITEDVVKVTA